MKVSMKIFGLGLVNNVKHMVKRSTVHICRHVSDRDKNVPEPLA
jgi:hypothetical protein